MAILRYENIYHWCTTFSMRDRRLDTDLVKQLSDGLIENTSIQSLK